MPNALNVILMGDFNQWAPKTNPLCGVWHETVMISTGRYEHRFWRRSILSRTRVAASGA